MFFGIFYLRIVFGSDTTTMTGQTTHKKSTNPSCPPTAGESAVGSMGFQWFDLGKTETALAGVCQTTYNKAANKGCHRDQDDVESTSSFSFQAERCLCCRAGLSSPGTRRPARWWTTPWTTPLQNPLFSTATSTAPWKVMWMSTVYHPTTTTIPTPRPGSPIPRLGTDAVRLGLRRPHL